MIEYRIYKKTKIRDLLSVLIIFLTTGIGSVVYCQPIGKSDPLERIHQKFVFMDMHAHPDRFHRANVDRISQEELNRYRSGLMDVVVCCVSTDAAYQGGYIKRDGTRIDRLPPGKDYTLQPGEAFAFTVDRLSRIYNTIEEGDAVLASSPSVVLKAKEKSQIGLIPALEGADGLEGKVENLIKLHQKGLRLLQLVHFRANELGYVQTLPYKAGGLTEFGKEVVKECNRLGIVVDLAHAHKQTTLDALKISKHSMISSHTGVRALHEGDRYLSDEEIRAIAEALLEYGFTEEEVGKVMGGNFFRLWEEVSGQR